MAAAARRRVPVLIVGGGIGGLALAVALQSRGVACWFRRGHMTIEWHETNRRSAAAAARERERLLGALRACGVTVRREV